MSTQSTMQRNDIQTSNMIQRYDSYKAPGQSRPLSANARLMSWQTDARF
jgi:hypothetical protein